MGIDEPLKRGFMSCRVVRMSESKKGRSSRKACPDVPIPMSLSWRACPNMHLFGASPKMLLFGVSC